MELGRAGTLFDDAIKGSACRLSKTKENALHLDIVIAWRKTQVFLDGNPVD